MKKETIILDNLNCPNCAADLERAFRSIVGVQSAKVTFATGTLELEYDEAQVTDEKIETTAKSFGVAIASRM